MSTKTLLDKRDDDGYGMVILLDTETGKINIATFDRDRCLDIGEIPGDEFAEAIARPFLHAWLGHKDGTFTLEDNGLQIAANHTLAIEIGPCLIQLHHSDDGIVVDVHNMNGALHTNVQETWGELMCEEE